MNLFKKANLEVIDYDEIRQEELNKIANIITEKRLELKFDRDVISNHLHIPSSILKAIEAADLTHLPEPVFTKQIIIKYANYLKLNGKELTENFSLESTGKVKNKKEIFEGFNFNLKINIKPQHLYVIYFLLLFFSIKSLNSILESPLFTQTKIPQKQIIETKTNPSIPSVAVTSNLEAISLVEKKAEKRPTASELTLKVNLKDDSWMKVSVDGKPSFEGILTKGTEKEWVAKEKITIRAGNAGGLMVSVNGEKPQPFGKAGQIQENTFELPARS